MGALPVPASRVVGPIIVDRWSRANERYLTDQISMTDAGSGIGAISKVLRLLLQSGILGLGAYLAIKGELSPGALIAGCWMPYGIFRAAALTPPCRAT